MNKFISKKVETFVMILYLRNGKYVSNFIYSLFLFDFSGSGNYSNNNKFLFYSFFPQPAKSLRKTLSLQEIENVVWKWKNIKQISSCTKREMLLGCIMFIKWNIDFGFRELIEILNVKAYPKFCSRVISKNKNCTFKKWTVAVDTMHI